MQLLLPVEYVSELGGQYQSSDNDKNLPAEKLSQHICSQLGLFYRDTATHVQSTNFSSSMAQSRCWEADSGRDGEEIPLHLCNLKVVALCALVVSVLVIRPKVWGFKPGCGRWMDF
jgi:hypothetical protein